MRVLIVDDHEVVRRGVRSLLSSRKDLEICGEAVDGRDAIAKARQLRPDVITMDISMPNLNGLDATREIRRLLPETPILIMSQHDIPQMMKQALEAGATAYIVKSAISTELMPALDRVQRREPAPGLVFGSAQANPDIHDILQRSSLLERALRESEEHFRLTFEHAGVGIAQVDPSGRWLRVNPKLCEIVGYSEAELRNMKFQDITHPEDLPGDLALTEQIIRGQSDGFSLEKRYIRKDGTSVWVHINVAALRDADRNLKHFVSVVQDISARKKTEQELLSARHDLQTTAVALAAQAEALDKLNQCNSHLWPLTNLQEGLQEILKAVTEWLAGDKAHVQLVDHQRGTLSLVALHGFDQTFERSFLNLPIDDNNPWTPSFRSGERILIEDIANGEADPGLLQVARSHGFRALVSTPLVGTDGKPLGLLSVYFLQPHRLSRAALQLLDLYVHQASNFLQRCKSESVRREREELFRAIVQSSDDAIVSKDLNATITSWNAAAQRIFGYTPEEAVGKSITMIIPPELQGQETEILARLRAGERIDHFETVRCTKTGERRHVSLTISPVRDSHGRVVGASKIARDITERKHAERLLKEAELSGRLLQLQDEERRRMARELHDGAGQFLAAISMSLSKIAKETQKLSPALACCIQENQDLAQQAIAEIRTLSHLLHPPLLDEVGLDSALREFVTGFSARSNIQVHLQIPANLDSLPRDHALSLFRIVQECLTNIHRHSGSSTALVRLLPGPRDITLEVADQGCGIAPEILQKFNSGACVGVGLRGMRERVQQIGGSLQIRSGHTGTSVIAVLPWHQQSPSRVGLAHLDECPS